MNRFVVFAGLLALAAGVPVPEAEAEAEAEAVAVEAVEAVPATLNAVPAGAVVPFLVRAPAHDSASIESHRLGGNFAYAVAEAHAYAQATPQISTITHPVAETTVVHEPSPIAHVTPGQLVTTKHIPAPVVETRPVFGTEPVVEARTTYHQPLFKTQSVVPHVAHVPQVAQVPVTADVHTVAAPAHYAHPGYGYAGFHGHHGLHGLHGLRHPFAFNKVISPIAAPAQE